MKEFEVVIRIKNNRLLETRRNKGLSQKQVANYIGVSTNTYSAYECLDRSPLNKRGELRTGILELCSFFEKDFSELFPDSILGIKLSKAVRQVDAADLQHQLSEHSNKLLMAPDVVVNRHELSDRVRQLMSNLSVREAFILTKLYGFDGEGEHTHQEIGDLLNISGGRVRQIICKSLRHLRHPRNSKKIKIFVDGSKMHCICGDYYCLSCGPAQGNHHCPVCGSWSWDGGCEDEDQCQKLEIEMYQPEKEIQHEKVQG